MPTGDVLRHYAPSVEPIALTELHPLVAAAVQAAGLEIEVLRCDADLADTEAFCRAYAIAPEDSVNTILVAGKGGSLAGVVLVACAVLATDRLDVNGVVRRRLGAKKASFASPDVAVAATAMERGGVTVLGLRDEIPVWIDARVMARERVVLGGGNRTSKLRLAPGQLTSVCGFEVVDGLALAAPLGEA